MLSISHINKYGMYKYIEFERVCLFILRAPTLEDCVKLAEVRSFMF